MEFNELKTIIQQCNTPYILKKDGWAYLHCEFNSFTVRFEFYDISHDEDNSEDDDCDEIEFDCDDSELNILSSYNLSHLEIYSYKYLDNTLEYTIPYRFIYNNILFLIAEFKTDIEVRLSECGIIGPVEYEWNDCMFCQDDSKCFGFYINISRCIDIIKLIKGLKFKDQYTTEYVENFSTLNGTNELDLDIYSHIPILPSNTKTRRLGYLKLLLQMLDIYKRINVSILSRRFELYCSDSNNKLYELKQTKGNVIITKNGTSAQPYIDIALKFGLISIQNNVVELGKEGKVYLLLNKELNIDNDNLFILTLFDKTFFFELINRHDYFLTSTIIERFSTKRKYSFNDIKDGYYNILLRKFKDINDFFYYIVADIPRSTKEANKRIEEWKKPEVYLKHVLYPRLNRLYELGLIDMSNDNLFQVTIQGEIMSYYISAFESVYVQPMDANTLLNKYGVSMINKLYDIKAREFLLERDECYLIKYINESFDLFRTIAPNRTTFSMLCTYVRYKLLFNNQIALEVEECIKYIENSDNYIIKLQKQYKDGYVQRK